MKITQLKEEGPNQLKKMQDWLADYDVEYDAHESYLSDNYELDPGKRIIKIKTNILRLEGIESSHLPYKFEGEVEHCSVKKCDLENLKGLPNAEELSLNDLQLISSLSGCAAEVKELYVSECGVTNLHGCPKKLDVLEVIGCDQLENFDGIASRINDLTIDIGDIKAALHLHELLMNCDKLTIKSWYKDAPDGGLGLMSLTKIPGLKKLDVIGGGMISKAGKAIKIIAKHLGKDATDIIEALHDADLEEFARYGN